MTMQYPKIGRDQQGGEASLHQESLQHPDGPAGHHGRNHLLVRLRGQRQGLRQGEQTDDRCTPAGVWPLPAKPSMAFPIRRTIGFCGGA